MIRLGQKRKKRGAAITEYAAVIAFVGLLATILFAWLPGKLGPTVSVAFSSVSQGLNNMVATSNNPPI